MSQETPCPPSSGISPLPLSLLCVLLSACLAPLSEECGPNLVCPSGQHCAARQQVCIQDSCGDGQVQAGETCDDGNLRDGDGCNRTCVSDESCGNGEVDIMGLNADGTLRGEACDDGNHVDGDGCSADCKSNELCGNGLLDVHLGEKCDDANRVGGDGCSADCLSFEYCGNGYADLAAGEACDDGDHINGDGCSADCKSNEACGNGYADLAVGEACDDGNNDNGDGCSANCQSNEACGNSYVDITESCDDGNTQDGDLCSADCGTIPPTCGNGVLDAGELCDDRNLSDGDDCSNQCKPTYCGDSIPNGATKYRKPEQCDSGGESKTCNIDCTRPRCGDGIVNASAGEVCDDGNEQRCGTCSQDCKLIQAERFATGRIFAVAAMFLSDEETFVIDDGFTKKVFEFQVTGTIPPFWPAVAVPIPSAFEEGASDPQVVAAAIRNAIETQRTRENFRILTSSSAGVVSLTHAYPSPAYNISITEQVAASSFRVEGMSGGSARDCPKGTSCRYTGDCAVGLECKAGVCG